MMLILPTTSGYTFGWETGEISKRTGKPLMNYFEHTSKKVVEAKRREMMDKGYKVTKVTECIF